MRQNLLQQYIHHVKEGVRYYLNGKEYRESHYDVSIITALENFIESRNGIYDPDIVFHKLIQTVGKAQQLVPVHIANEYCCPDRLLAEDTNFSTATPLKRTMSLYKETEEDYMPAGQWYPLTSNELGEKFAVLSSGDLGPGGLMKVQGDRAEGHFDLGAMQALYDNCKTDFLLVAGFLKNRLKRNLSTSVLPDMQLMSPDCSDTNRRLSCSAKPT